MRAYILLKVMPQETMQLMHALKNIEAITEASLVHGPYDCVLVVHGKDLDELNAVILAVRSLPGVTDSLTYLVVQSWQRTAA